MFKGIHLTLLIGPAVPVPAPQVVMDSISSIQVTNSKDRSGFQISFTVGKKSPLMTTMIPAGYFDPIVTRVILVVTINGLPNVIMDGLVTNHELSPANEPGKSTFTITGEDLSLAMDLVEYTTPLPAMPDDVKVRTRLAPYAALGIVPVVIPPFIPAVKSPTNRHETQPKVTDRAYIKSLAQRNSFVFFVEPGPLPGQSIAYFGPDINVPNPQAALSVNMDAASNVDSMSFSLNGMAKKIKIFNILDPITKRITIPVPVPNVNAFKPPLGSRPLPPSKIELADSSAKLEPDEAAREILSFMVNESAAAISGNGSLDVVRYKRLLKARMLVGVRGAGVAYDGMYYVDSVTHNIKPGEYKQNFSLSRDGLISSTPILNTQ